MTSFPPPQARALSMAAEQKTGVSHAVALSLLFFLFALLSPLARAAEIELPDGPDRSLIYAKCRTCHDLQYVIESKGISAGSWDGLLDDMEGFGVELTPEERDRVLAYLSAYMSNTPPPEPVQVASGDATAVDGQSVFMDNCTSCHQEDAMGIEETFPPLAANSDLFLAEDFPLKVLLNGMTGEITVNDQVFEGEMPPFGHLSDAEIAAVVNFLRNSFGNDALAHSEITTVTPEMVQSLRASEMDPEQVLEYRASLIN